MTLGDIIELCVSKIGITDNVARARAQSFAKLRWKMLWDSENWKQSRFEVTGTVPKDTEEVTLPPEVETVLAGRINGSLELLPTQDLTELSTDPAGVGTAGATVGFSMAPRDASGNARIRLHRPLSSAADILLICKRKCVELSALTDTPSIPGADQCLVAYTLGDLLEWMRQYTKAQAKFAEGEALLQKMKEIERKQSARRVRIIPFVEPGAYDFNGFEK